MIGLTWDKWASVERQPLVFSGFDLVEEVYHSTSVY